MISTAQKKARENFKKAIEYRKKTGCTLKQAFAHISGKKTVTKKVITVKKVGNVTLKKSNRFVNDDRYIIMNDGKEHLQGKAFSKTTAKEIANSLKKVKAKRKIAIKKVGSVKKKVLYSRLKKKAAKKPSEQSILNKIHKVKHDVEKLDESQHKHMTGMGAFDKHIFAKLESVSKEIDQREFVIKSIIIRKKDLVHRNGLSEYKNILKRAKGYVAELKKHKTELKKHI